MERKGFPDRLESGGIKSVLKDFAYQAKEEKNWKEKQYQEKEKRIYGEVNGIRAKGGNCQLPWEEVRGIEDGEFYGFAAVLSKMGEDSNRFRKGIG